MRDDNEPVLSGVTAGCDDQRAGQVHLARAGPAVIVAVLGADSDLFRPIRHSRAAVDASTTGRLHEPCSGPQENLDVSLLFGVVFDPL